jgi:hypothetical protein
MIFLINRQANGTHVKVLTEAMERQREALQPLTAIINGQSNQYLDLEGQPVYNRAALKQFNQVSTTKPPQTVAFVTSSGVQSLPTQQMPPPGWDEASVTLPIRNGNPVTLPVVDGHIIGLRLPPLGLPSLYRQP